MRHTIDQALQQGIAAHNEGKIKKAKRLYRAVLVSQPKNPVANHNLGLLAVSENKHKAALPLFQKALEANPREELFWCSLIDTLMKVEKFENAKIVLDQAKTHGIEGEKINLVKSQLGSISKRQNITSASPSREQLTIPLEHYNHGRYDEAEKSTIFLTQQFPEHKFSYKLLGAILAQTGRAVDAKAAFSTALEIDPKDAEVHSNLGVVLQQLREFKDSETSLRQSIILKADIADTHYNLGVTLKELGKIKETETSLRQAIRLKSNFPEAYLNLGNLLKELGRLEEAEASYRQVIVLKPDFADAHNNLGVTLGMLDRLQEAEASFEQAVSLKPDYIEAHSNLGNALRKLGKYKAAILHYDLVMKPNAVSQSLECLYINKNYSEFDERMQSISALDDKNIRVAAVSAFTAHQMEKKDPYPFCTNPLDFIVIRNLSEFVSDSKDLVQEIIKEADGYQLVWESRTTKFGFQGPNDFFENPSQTVARLESVVLKSMQDYHNKFTFETNTFIQSWPKKQKIRGWYNRLVKNGYQTSHIHPGGWLSGVIYLKTIDSSGDDQGAIEFGLHGYELPIINDNYPRKLHNPKKGDIVLFPSSLFHRTIPFKKDTERCVVAFDLMPN